MRREVIGLALAVVVVDALFIAGYFLFHLERLGGPVKLAYTAAWTIVTLAVVLRALIRIRSLRVRGGLGDRRG